MSAPPASALAVPITDCARESVDLSADAAMGLMLPLEDTMLELRSHEEPDLQVRSSTLSQTAYLMA